MIPYGLNLITKSTLPLVCFTDVGFETHSLEIRTRLMPHLDKFKLSAYGYEGIIEYQCKHAYETTSVAYCAYHGWNFSGYGFGRW